MKALKLIGKVLLVILIVIVAALLVVFIYNRVMMSKESDLLEKPLGQMVEVDGHKMCVYTEGEGEHTLVFLSGSGTASPILDFKTLYSKLDGYRIVVIEKFGYGFSDVVDEERSFDTILRQDRMALEKAGISGKLILCPHSMSGVEALLWAQKYPDEVEAIVGLDMALPRSYDSYEHEATEKFEKFAAVGREAGVIRFFYADSTLPDSLTNEEKELYRAIACKKAVNVNIMYEGRAIPEAVKEIDGQPIPDIPILMFVSDGKETGLDKWVQIQKDFAKEHGAELIELDCGHYVHNEKADEISGKIKEFTDSLDAKKE
ncbi:MAG: alpha/beta hydrolase [Ruminococcus sp.]|nr:alpha/beta hydrolase [Ruminococcus sp.]